MATATTDQLSESVGAPRRTRRRKTSHLKKVPETRAQREQLRSLCTQVAAQLDKTNPLGKDEMEKICRSMLDEAGLSEG